MIEISEEFDENVCVNLKEKAIHYNNLLRSADDDSLNQPVKGNDTEKNIKDGKDREIKYSCSRLRRNEDCCIKDFCTSDLENIIFFWKKKSTFRTKLNQFRDIFRRKDKKDCHPRNNSPLNAEYKTEQNPVSFKEDLKRVNISISQDYEKSKKYNKVKKDINDKINKQKTKRWPNFNLTQNIFRKLQCDKDSPREKKVTLNTINGSKDSNKYKGQNNLNDEIKAYASDSIITDKISLGKKSKKVNKHALDIKDNVDGEKSKRLPRLLPHSLFRKRKRSQQNNGLKSIQLNNETESKEDLKSKEQVHLNTQIKKYASDSVVTENDFLAEKSETVNKNNKEGKEKSERQSARFFRAFSRKKKSKHVSESDANPNNERR